MKTRLLPLLFALPLTLSACGNDETTQDTSTAPATSTSAASSTASKTTKAPHPTSSTTEPEVDESPVEPTTGEPSPVSFACGDWHLYQAGTAIYSDGSTGYEESCYQPMMDAARANATPQPEVDFDPSKVPYADGGTCPAAVCGYGHDENGNPNPSSGEIQSWWTDCVATNSDDYCRANDPYQ